MDPEKLVPSSPNPTSDIVWGGYLRTMIAMLGGMGIGVGALANVSVEQWSTVISAAAPLAGLAATGGAAAWSRWQKYRQATLDHAGSVASAEMRMPVKAVAP
jgi:hypothetical protein